MEGTEEEEVTFEQIGAVTRRIVDGLNRCQAGQVEKKDGPTANIDRRQSTRMQSALATSDRGEQTLVVWKIIGPRPA